MRLEFSTIVDTITLQIPHFTVALRYQRISSCRSLKHLKIRYRKYRNSEDYTHQNPTRCTSVYFNKERIREKTKTTKREPNLNIFARVLYRLMIYDEKKTKAIQVTDVVRDDVLNKFPFWDWSSTKAYINLLVCRIFQDNKLYIFIQYSLL